jgi:hypothetical protein
MVTTRSQKETSADSARKAETSAGTGESGARTGSRLTGQQVWQVVARASFCVVSYVTPAGEPRSSGVVYKAAGRRLYLVVAPESWKAKYISASGQAAVTVPVRRGGVLSLLFPIPPATVSFHARAIVHPAGSVDFQTLPKELVSLLPPTRRDMGCVIELLPEGTFVTYGLGVSLMGMRDPVAARARVPVG